MPFNLSQLLRTFFHATRRQRTAGGPAEPGKKKPRGWKRLVLALVIIVGILFGADAKTGARTGAISALTATLEDLIFLFMPDNFDDVGTPDGWTEVDDDEDAPPAAPDTRPPAKPGKKPTQSAPAQPANPPSCGKAGKLSVDAARSPTFYVASWNVENLFDTLDDRRKPYDDEFTPTDSSTRWTLDRYNQKLDHLAQVIRFMNDGKGPDILGLVEIETPSVVEDLIGRLKGRDYDFAYAESPDLRGIDVALLYDRRRFTLSTTDHYRVPRPAPLTRDILRATLRPRNGGPSLHFFVNHWPSRGVGIEESNPQRRVAARTLLSKVRDTFRRAPSAAIFVMGDFNDTPTDDSIADTLSALPPPSGKPANFSLYNLAHPLAIQGKGTHAFCARGRQEWKMYDQLIVSGALLRPNAPVAYVPSSYEIISPPFMQERHGWRRGTPIPTYAGTSRRYRGGYSDHFPVGALFTLSP